MKNRPNFMIFHYFLRFFRIFHDFFSKNLALTFARTFEHHGFQQQRRPRSTSDFIDVRTKSDQKAPNVVKIDLIDQNWTKLVKMGLNGPKIAKFFPNLTKIEPNNLFILNLIHALMRSNLIFSHIAQTRAKIVFLNFFFKFFLIFSS